MVAFIKKVDLCQSKLIEKNGKTTGFSILKHFLEDG